MTLSDRRMLFRAAMVAVMISAVGLSACGRKGALQPPPSAKAVEGEAGEAAAKKPAGKDRPFVLDFLL